MGKIIQNLDSNKAHGHDNISIRMFKICGDSIYEPLEIIFRQALLTGVFPSEWKKGKIIPVHKKVTSKISKIMDQFLSFRFVVKYLKDFVKMFNEMLNFLPLMILFHQTSWDSNLENHVSTNYYQLSTKFTNDLMTD